MLLGALANPEHSEASRDILRALADERGLKNEEARGWEQTEDTMYVAPFGRRPTFEQALAAPARRRRVYRTLQFILLLCLVGGIFALSQSGEIYKRWVEQGIERGEVDPAAVARFRAMSPAPDDEKIYMYLHGLNLLAQDLLHKQQQGVSKADSYLAVEENGFDAGSLDERYVDAFNNLLSNELDTYINEQNVDDIYAFAFDYFTKYPAFDSQGPRIPDREAVAMALIIGGLLLWYIGSIFTWTRPCRTLLLRPFQAKKISKPLKRFTQKNLSFYGHTITLSDKYLKESFWAYVVSWLPTGPESIVAIPLFFIPAVRQFQRWIKVSSPRGYRFLKKRLARRFTMNLFWISSFNKLLKVKCSDVWWRQAVDLLMYSCQVIVVDVSWVKEGTEWELEKIDRRDLERKTLFIVSENAADNARAVIHRFWPHEEAPPPLYIYQNSGKLLDYEGYHREVARIISESHLWDGPQKEVLRSS